MLNIHWIAGFFDGEGCIYYNPGRIKNRVNGKEYKYPEFQILLGQSGESGKELLQQISEQLDWGRVRIAFPGKGAKSVAYVISRSGKHATRILKELAPYLIHKKNKALETLEIVENYYNC